MLDFCESNCNRFRDIDISLPDAIVELWLLIHMKKSILYNIILDLVPCKFIKGTWLGMREIRDISNFRCFLYM